MDDFFRRLEEWVQRGQRVALATVVRVERSAPRPPGTMMAISDGGGIAGSVSGGCVEGALYEEAQALLAGRRSAGILTYGISDDDAFAVGLSCGGTIHVFLEEVTNRFDLFGALAADRQEERSAALVTAIGGDRVGGKWLLTDNRLEGGPGELPPDVARAARQLLRQGETGILPMAVDGSLEWFVQSFVPPPDLYVFGAIDLAAATVRLGKFLGYRVTLCDARAAFATPERFPEADRVVIMWPHEFLQGVRPGPRDAICVLTHDPKFDVPVLEVALQTEAGYIGVLGSRRTHQKRIEALRQRGVSEEALGRLSAPAGLDIGGRSAEEIALSIAAEMVAVRHGKAGGRLSMQ